MRFRTHDFPFTEPSLEPDVSCFLCEGRGCSVCRHSGWIEIAGSGMVDPSLFEFVGLDPEEWSGFAFGMGLERVAMLRHGLPALGLLWENDLRVLALPRHRSHRRTAAKRRHASSSARPYPADTNRSLRPSLTAPRPRRSLVGANTEMTPSPLRDRRGRGRDRRPPRDRHRRGRADLVPGRRRRRREPRPLPRRTRPRGRQAPQRGPPPAVPGRRGGGGAAPDRLRRVELRPRRDGRSRAPGSRPPGRPDARAREAPGNRVRRDDPLRDRARARRRPRGHPRPLRALGAGHAARRRPSAGRGDPRDRGDAQPSRLPLRLRDRPRGRGPLRGAAPRAPGRRARADRRGDAGHRDRGLRGLPALHRTALPRRPHRPVAAVAQGADHGGRDAPDLERRRRDELRDARRREPAARVRLRHARGRPHRRPPGAAGRGVHEPRRQPAEARSRGPRHRRRRARDRLRRDHGRPRHGGARGDDLRPPRGGELRAGHDPLELGAPRAPHGGVEPLGERRRPLPRARRGTCSPRG